MPPRRSGCPNVLKSYKNSCGAPAPRGKIYQPASLAVTKKSVLLNKAKTRIGGSLTYTKSGEKLPPGAVSFLKWIPLSASLKWCVSGAVAVAMGEQLFSVTHAMSLHSVPTVLALMLVMRILCFNVHLVFWKQTRELFMYVKLPLFY